MPYRLRRAGFMLVLSLIGLARASVVIVDTAGFEGYSIGEVVGQSAGPGSWERDNLFQGLYNPAFIADMGTDHGRVLAFNDGPGPGPLDNRASGVRVAFPDLVVGGATGAEVQFDFLRDGDGGSNSFFWMPYTNNQFGGYQTDAFSYPQRKILPVGSNGPSFSIVSGRWTTIRLVYGFDDNTTTAFMNGTLVANRLPAAGPLGDFTGFAFADYNNGGPAQRAYIDNFRIDALYPTEVPEPGALALLATGALALPACRRRRKF